MSRLTRDGTAEPVSRDQISGTYGDREMFIFPVQLTTSRIGNLTRLIHTLLYVTTIHTGSRQNPKARGYVSCEKKHMSKNVTEGEAWWQGTPRSGLVASAI